ncbi:hypothetical protein HPB50_023695 [Hyalomma asiaticum]|uniref:Uncharacterized protein n=1 Tax=Hyalomma asiaticum TaxID=266040 RepID=A0ACB7T6Z4_HYAAI|nr:hypothetical protein HPB50_023695 [Hyalomma asiaticum]
MAQDHLGDMSSPARFEISSEASDVAPPTRSRSRHRATPGASPRQDTRPKGNLCAILRAHLKELLYRSHIPGMKVVMGPCVPARRRARWVFMLTVFTALTCWDIVRTVAEFLERPVAIDIELSEMEDGELPLPAITICNLNAMRRSVLCGNDDALKGQQGAEKWKQRLCNGRPMENVWMTEEVLQEAENFTQWVKEVQRGNKTLAMHIGHQREGLFLECNFGDMNCLNDSLLYAIPYGRYGTCYCFNFRHGLTFAPEHRDDVRNGLRMVLDTEIEEYLPLSAEAGFKVMIHEPGVEADYNRNGVHIPPEFASYLRLEKTTLQRLEPPYPEPCRHDWPPGYKEILYTQTSYTRENDVLETLHVADLKRNEELITVAKLIIYLDGEKIEKRKRYAQFPPSSLVTNIGGTMGIYLGLSFLTLFSLADTVATALARTITTLTTVKAAPTGHDC